MPRRPAWREPAAALTVPSGKPLPSSPGDLGVSPRTAFSRISLKELSESLPRAAGQPWRRKHRAQKGCEAWGSPVTPQFRTGAAAPRPKEALAPVEHTPTLPQPGGSGRAQSLRSSWTAGQGQAEVPAFGGQRGRRHFNLLRAGPQRRGSG